MTSGVGEVQVSYSKTHGEVDEYGRVVRLGSAFQSCPVTTDCRLPSANPTLY